MGTFSRMLLFSAVVIGCASGEETTPEFSMGTGTQNGTGTPVGGNAQAVYPNCQNDANCYAGEICDSARGICVAATNQMGGSSPNAGDGKDMGVGGPSQVDAAAPSGGNGCSNPGDIAIFQVGVVCVDGCEEGYTNAEAMCQQTPARIADCLAEAARNRDNCLGLCNGVPKRVGACVGQCSDLSTIETCGLDCLRQSFRVSAGCESCLSDVIQCGGNICQSLCLNGAGAECTDCLTNSCGQSFSTCAGIMFL